VTRVGTPEQPRRCCRSLTEDLAYGTYIHLGLGNPALVGRYVPDGIEAVAFHGNGFIAIGSCLSAGAGPDQRSEVSRHTSAPTPRCLR
jgi:acyl CoA:acetate/3-ketoacid CoA transferase beta subunit